MYRKRKIYRISWNYLHPNLMMEKNRRIYELINEYIKYGNKWENDSKGVKVLHAYKKAKESQK